MSRVCLYSEDACLNSLQTDLKIVDNTDRD